MKLAKKFLLKFLLKTILKSHLKLETLIETLHKALESNSLLKNLIEPTSLLIRKEIFSFKYLWFIIWFVSSDVNIFFEFIELESEFKLFENKPLFIFAQLIHWSDFCEFEISTENLELELWNELPKLTLLFEFCTDFCKFESWNRFYELEFKLETSLPILLSIILSDWE